MTREEELKVLRRVVRRALREDARWRSGDGVSDLAAALVDMDSGEVDVTPDDFEALLRAARDDGGPQAWALAVEESGLDMTRARGLRAAASRRRK